MTPTLPRQPNRACADTRRTAYAEAVAAVATDTGTSGTAAPGAVTSRTAAPGAVTLGEHVGGQLRRLCGAAGFTAGGRYPGDALTDLLDLLGPVARRPLAAGPPSPSFVCDDHSPVEFSLSFPAAGSPAVRVLVEPGCGATSLADNGRLGMRALEALAARHGFSTEPVRRVEDLFLPPAIQGSFALWCAMDLRRDGPPGIKVYVNPQAHGPDRSADVVREALTRSGFGRAWPALREGALSRGHGKDVILFVALDLGRWQAPRLKVYVAHHGATAAQVRAVSRLMPGGRAEDVDEFCRAVGGDPGHFTRRPLVSCLSYTAHDLERPSGHTLHVPVRDYVPDDAVALGRATAVLRHHRTDTDTEANVDTEAGVGAVGRALAAMTPRRASDGVGLITYVSLVRSRRQPPRVTVYFSPEAYGVRPPRVAERPLPADTDSHRCRTAG
ncbi:tryptophan dimethylallyltransferase family protein [Streptomyces sp. MMBL 11-3]|uniref:tryptophan dimethylallyltransferase family protein n=1 Tax=Streptomyces sp. MMBL 11-3 TaxID=3382639 RepID=UPI0039B698AE